MVGAEDFTAPEIKIDLKVGGRHLYCMRVAGFDRVVKNFCIVGKFTEIVPMERIISTLSFADEHGNPVSASYYGMPGDWPMEETSTVTFEEVDNGKTKLTVQEVGIPGEMTEPVRMGWEQSLDKLAESLK
ncbi:Activator of Hsp90 ATPase -like protein [uncultured archaeon]|nr:Activator of Hsp90 ATPase -like protein [uncultured archaeon]